MKEFQIKRNTLGEVTIDDHAKTNGINIALVDEKGTPVARYEFDSKKILNLTKLSYNSNSVRIHFHSNIIPTMISELTSAKV